MTVKSKILQKICACFALICFISSLAPAPGVFASSSEFIRVNNAAKAATTNIPANLGTLRETFQGSSGKSIILIQDAHANYDVQTSIRKLIDHFQKKSGINFVALEGGSGPLDLGLLRAFPDQKSKEFVMDEYVRAGELSGAEMAAVVNVTPSQYVGIEDAKLYEENKQAFFSALEEHKNHRVEFSKIRAELDQRSLKIDSPELRKLRTRKVEAIADLAREYKLDVKKFSGFEQIVDALKEKLFQSEAQRALDREFQRFEALERISSLEATREDLHFSTPFLKEFKIDLKPALKFYDLAFKRDDVFAKAIMSPLERGGAEGDGVCKIIFVAGGFHTNGIKQKLRQVGISYQVVTPKISSVGTNENYLKVMRGEVSYARPSDLENEIASAGDDDAKIVMRRKLQEWRMRVSGLPPQILPILDRQLGIAALAPSIQTSDHPRHQQFLDAASLRLLIHSAQTTKPNVTIDDVIGKLETAFGRPRRKNSGIRSHEIKKSIAASSLGEFAQPSKEKLHAKIERLEDLKEKIEKNTLPELVYFGDKHGAPTDLDEVIAIAKRARARGTKLHIIGHGDAFDRGFDNVGVWRIFRQLKKMSEKNSNIRVTFLLGNHEVSLIRDQLMKHDGQHRLQWRGGMGGDMLIREFKKKYGDDHIEKLKELAIWVLENGRLYEIDEAGILHVHAGIPTNESGKPLIALPHLEDWQAELEEFQSKLRALGSLAEKEDWFAARHPYGVTNGEALLELFMESSSTRNVRPVKWLDIIPKKQFPFFLAELGVNGIVVGHQRAETLRQYGDWIFLIDAGFVTNDSFLTLNPSGLVWHLFEKPIREIYDRKRMLTLIGNEITMLQVMEASSPGSKNEALRWIGDGLWNEFARLSGGKEPSAFSFEGTPAKIKNEMSPAFEKLLAEGRGGEYAILLLKIRDVQGGAWKWQVLADRISEFGVKTNIDGLSKGLLGIYTYEFVISLTVHDQSRSSSHAKIYLEDISIGKGVEPALRGKRFMSAAFANAAKILENEFPTEDIGTHAIHFIPAKWFAKYFSGRIVALHDYDETTGHKMYFSPPMALGRMGKYLNPADPADLKTFIKNIEKAATPGQTAEQIFSGTELVLFGTIKGNSLGDDHLRKLERDAQARPDDAGAHAAYLKELARVGRWDRIQEYYIKNNLRSFDHPTLETYFEDANRHLAAKTAINISSGIQLERTLTIGVQAEPGRNLFYGNTALSLDGNTLVLGSDGSRNFVPGPGQGDVEVYRVLKSSELPDPKGRRGGRNSKAASLGSADEIKRELRLTMNLIHVDKLEDPQSGKLKPETAQAIVEARKKLEEQASEIFELTQIPEELSTALANARGLLQHVEDRFVVEGGKLPLAPPAPKPAPARSYASSVTREPGGGIRVDFFIPRDFEVKLFDRRGASVFAFHPHYNTWTIGFEDGTVEYLTVKFSAGGSKAQIFPESANLSSPITAVAYDPSGDLVAAGTRNGNVIVWDSNKAFELLAQASKTNREISSLAFNPNGKDLAIGTSSRLMLWDFKQPYSSARKLGDSGVRSLAYSSDGTRLAVLTDKFTVKLWDLSGQEPKMFSFEEFIKRHAPGCDSVFEMVLSPDGNEIAVMLSNRSLRRFNVKNPASPVLHVTPETSGLNLMRLAYSPDGKELAAVDDNWGTQSLVRWNLRGPGYRPQIDSIVETKRGIHSIAYSPDGRQIACLSSDGVYFCIFPKSSGKSLGSDESVFKETLAAEVDRILVELGKIGAGAKNILDYLIWRRQKNLRGVEDAGMLEKVHALFKESLIRKHPDFVLMLQSMFSYLRKKEQFGAADDVSLVSKQIDRSEILAKINNRSGLPVFQFTKDNFGKVMINANTEFFDPTITDIYIQTYLKALRRLAGENPRLAGFLAKKMTAPKYFDYFALSDFKQFVTEFYHKRGSISSEELALKSFEYVLNYAQSAFNNERQPLGKKRKFALADKNVRADYRRAFLISKYVPSRIVPLRKASAGDWKDPNVMILDDAAYRVPEWRPVPGKEDTNYPGEIVVLAHWKKMFFFFYVSRSHTALKSSVHQWRSSEMFLGGRYFIKNEISENLDDVPGHLSTMLDQAIYDQGLVQFEGPEKFDEFRSGYLNMNAALAGDMEYPKFKEARAQAQSLGGLPKANEFLAISPRTWIGDKLWKEFRRVSGGEKFKIVHMAGTFDELSFPGSSKTLKKTLDGIEEDPFVLLVVHNQYEPSVVHHVVVFDRLSEIKKRESMSLILLGEFPNNYFEYGMHFVAYDSTEARPQPMLVFRRASLGKLSISEKQRNRGFVGETVAQINREIFQKKYPGLKIEGWTDQYAIGKIFLKVFQGRLAISGLNAAPLELRPFLNQENPADLDYFLKRMFESAKVWNADVTTFDKQFNLEGKIKDADGKSLGANEEKKILGDFSANSLGTRQTAIRLLAGKTVDVPKEAQKLIDEAGVITDEDVDKVLSLRGAQRRSNLRTGIAALPSGARNDVALAIHIDSLPDELSPKAVQILSQIKKLILVFPQGDERAERIVELVGRNVKRFPYVGEIPVQDIQRALEKERGVAKGFLTQNLNVVSDRLNTTREKIFYFELDGRQYRDALAENALTLILRLTQNPESIHEWQGVAKAASLGHGALGISFDLGALVEKLTVLNDSGKSLARAA